ncbi:MAG: SDR family oxidoreductase [Chloroflexota bacterium]|nr:SDR family oxidoreductase [Chloroflexota bacterium]MDE2840273.1 SDR family oxidoreductase [Chloroflexota bacterium]MDE2930361.1 SDR family oxidoreductase [Chloroflexota bacterium]
MGDGTGVEGRLAGKVAVIAGAGGGMGSATPLHFAREGAKVLLVARRAGPLTALAQEIEERGGEAAIATADLATPDGAAAMAQAALDRWGRIDVLFDNLGDYAFGDQKLHETAPDEWRYLISINVDTAYYCTHAVLPTMVAQGSGCILLVSAARRTRREANVGYAAGKEALVGLTRTLAREYREHGIRVNCICPGAIGDSRGAEDAELPPTALARDGHPADVALSAVYLAGGEAAWVTGQILDVDGGDSL